MNSQTSGYIKVTYTQFNELLEDQKIEKALIRNSTLYGDLTAPILVGKTGDRMSKKIEVEVGMYDYEFVQKLVEQGVDFSIEPGKTWVNILISTLPWIFIFGVWLFIIKQMQGGPKGVFTFGKSKAKLITEDHQKVTFIDVAGVEEAKQELQEIIEFLIEPRKFQRLGGKLPKGALLVGPPGTGKTLLARAVAGEAGVPFFSMSGSDFVEMFVGVGASRVRDLFDQGKNNAPCIIFIDEIDAVGRQRGAGIGGGHDEREQTLNQLLVEMDGFESNEGVILLAATNRPDVLDPALLRPGRFDRQIVVDWPDVRAREQILKVHVKKIQTDQKVNLDSIAKGTPGMTGADLANVVNEAALLAARLNRKKVTMADFEEAKDKVMMGAARKSLVITEDEKRLIAFHEAGHVLVSKYVTEADPVHKVSIIARGRALGLTHFLPSDEKHNWSYKYCIGKLIVLLGGRAAEMIKFTDITNGASNDIETATGLARKMVCEWGMSKRLGPLTFGKKESEIFLGREIATHKDYSEETAISIDQEIREIVETSHQKAESIIREHTDKLEAIAAELLKNEILTGDQIDRILNDTNPVPKKHVSWRKRKFSSASSGKKKKEAAPDDTRALQPTNVSLKTPGVHQDQQNKQDVQQSKKSSDTEDKNKSSKDDNNKKNISSSKSPRSRMIRLKTGGRQRTIRKAPAKKIRKIN
ncbi:ATP-dependent zinc metalloprotease FtsH [Candidatus Latescibacterota bacterium]